MGRDSSDYLSFVASHDAIRPAMSIQQAFEAGLADYLIKLGGKNVPGSTKPEKEPVSVECRRHVFDVHYGSGDLRAPGGFYVRVYCNMNGTSGRQVTPQRWLVGGVAGLYGAAAGVPAGITALPMLLLGILVAVDRRLDGRVVAALAAALGLLHGALNGAGIAAAGRDAIGLLGIAGAVVVLTALVATGMLALRQPWTRIAVRVAGSWIAATGLLLAGWTLSGRI